MPAFVTSVAFFFKSRSIEVCQTRSIQSGERNAQIFLVVVGVVILLSSAQSAADHALF